MKCTEGYSGRERKLQPHYPPSFKKKNFLLFFFFFTVATEIGGRQRALLHACRLGFSKKPDHLVIFRYPIIVGHG